MRGWMGKFRSLILFGALTLFLSGCGVENMTALKPEGYGANLLFDLMMISIAIMLFVFIIVMAIYTFVLIRYRQKKGQEDYIPKQTEGNKALEMIWTVIPIILLLVLAVPTVQATFDLADTGAKNDEDAITIEVTGNQYWWHFNYKGQEITTSQDLYIPTGERVYLDLKSSDVIHSFWVPSIAGKMDTNPGENVNSMYLEAFEEGVYWGQCAELCGPSHSLMDFKVIAVSPEEFDQWVKDMQNVDPEAEPKTASAKEGQELFNNNCMSCHAIGSGGAGIAPNLTNFGNRTMIAGILEPTKENLVNWIVNPDEIKPGNQMPANLVSEEEASKIADYLLQLKHSEVTPDSAGDNNQK
ncbi:cytochrome c oxidase subunit II [Halobacillus naozhouensis]|uniref:Cytochrome c oxidase subunit 2 n=1 Tax=Halobacillus naozhouensis TaxID=554880 RepID=A0ABY8J3F8_9BACI|nr:cytochrome c oxidase subunit II [Halobacillus naozhouensis]WFT76612.1 cytochrome c oxidase subunit II [Halobacillus naozhouensis]